MKDIKDFLKRLFRTPMLLVFALICVVLLPSAINLRSLEFRAGIVVALGIDTNEDDLFVLDAVITVPSTEDNLTENNKIITSTGVSVIDALSNMNVLFGKTMRLGHTRYVIIGSSISQKNLATAIDGLIRTNKLRDSVQLIVCQSSIHDMFNAGVELKNKTGIRLSDIICHIEYSSTTALDSNVDSFYKGYFSKSKISKLNCISLTNDHTDGISLTQDAGEEGEGNQNAGTDNNQNSSTQNKYISNKGEIAIFKEGVLMRVLPSNISRATNWIDAAYLPKKLVVETKSVENVDKICFDILAKSVKFESFFLHNIPMLCTKINITIEIDEIINNDNNVVPRNQSLVCDEVKSDIGRQIRREVGQAFDYSKQNKLDIMDINDIFYLNNNKEYMSFIQNDITPETFLENVQLNIDINIKIV